MAWLTESDHPLGLHFEEQRMIEIMLGSAITRPDTMTELEAAGWGEQDLDLKTHKTMWRCARKLREQRGIVDPALVEIMLVEHEVDEEEARAFVNACVRDTEALDNPRLPLFIATQKARAALRRIAMLGMKMTSAAHKPGATAAAIAAEAAAEAEKIVAGASTTSGFSGEAIARIAQQTIDARNKGDRRRISLGIPVIDDMLGGGARGGSIVTCGAETGIGKSTFTKFFVNRFIDQKIPSLMVSFEDTLEDVATSLIEARAGVAMPEDTTGLGALAWQKWARAQGEMSTAKFHLEATSRDRPLQLTVEELCAKIRRYIKQHGVRVVVVDYVQMIELSTRHGRDDMNWIHVSKALTKLVESTGILLFLMSQLKEIDSHESSKKNWPGPDESHFAFTKQWGKDCSVAMIFQRRKTAAGFVANLNTVRVVKNRYNGVLGSAHLLYTRETKQLEPCDESGTVAGRAEQVEIDDDDFIEDDDNKPTRSSR